MASTLLGNAARKIKSAPSDRQAPHQIEFRNRMIDPKFLLAFSMQSNRGVYALLLGSGVSRAAEIPTGWEITLDLVRKLAELYAEECEPDPESWFRGKFEHAPDYSQLLDQLAKEPTERQQLLEPYFEADEQEREEGKKQPTAAHHAIAQLAAQGFIRVIVTTNFDRLLETALNLVGIVPTVIRSVDQLRGALPLIHTECCVFKVHGDYKDSFIRNTPSELANYPDEFNRLLDRIFDEFGLVVCGWSGDWDEALRNAIYRAPSRRFTTYWAARGKLSDHAQKLIDHRQAQVIAIEDADSFFQVVQQNVESIEEFSKPHPLSVEAAVASLKRYLSEPKYEIKLADIIGETVESVVRETSGESFDLSQPPPTTQTVTARMQAYEAACSKLTAIAAVGGFWGKVEHIEIWQRALRRLCIDLSVGGIGAWVNLRRYPGSLLLYSLALGAVEANRLGFLSYILSTPVYERHQETLAAPLLLAPSRLFDDPTAMQILEGMERRYLPLNDWVYGVLRRTFQQIIPNDFQYERAIVKLEILIALNSIVQPKPGWMGVTYGTFMYRAEPSWQVLQELKASITYLQQESPFVKANIFGANAEFCLQQIEGLEKWIYDSVEPHTQRRWQALMHQSNRH